MHAIQKSFLVACLAISALALGSSFAFSQVSVSIDLAPPELPAYDQPACPDDGYMWTPGFWAYGDYGYYWVPGTWVQPPQFGLLWTPGYWGWAGNSYRFHQGYWGQNVGFYGGINYGYGYGGDGYDGGRWQGRQFSYNRSVNNVSTANIHNTYEGGSAFNGNSRSVSFNGGNGGVQAQATPQERQYASQQHVRATSTQQAHVRAASQDRSQLATANGGSPATLAAARPQAYTGVAQQHAKTQPLTQQDAVKTQHTTSAQSGTGTTSEPQFKTAAQTQSSTQTTHPTVSHETAALPQHKTAVTHSAPSSTPQFHPQAQSQPQHQFHPQAQSQAKPQSHPQAQAKQASHPAPQGKPQAHADKPQTH
jgi:hypothetical protein